MKTRNYHIPIFVPHRGCPHDCVFCNQRHITGSSSETTAADVSRIIDEYLKTISKNGGNYIEAAFFGGSFTGIELEKQTELLEAAYVYVKKGAIQGIRCSTRPDYISEKILDNLKKYSVSCVELGVQSTDDTVLELSRRGHTFDDVVEASGLIKKYGIELGLQMMLGLPGDTEEKILKTARDIISLKPDCVRIYPTLVVEDTALCDMYEKNYYLPLELDDTVRYLSILIPMFERENIEIIRVGLQTTDEINVNTVRGPYHPALRELAEGRIIRNAVEKFILNNAVKNTAQILCNPSRVSEVVGHKKANTFYFLEKYNIKLKITSCDDQDKNMLKICGKNIDIYS